MDVSIPRKKDGLPLLYKSDIEEIAEMYLWNFNPQILKEPMQTPIDEFLENYLKLDMDYKDITQDGSILGLTAFDNGFLNVYDSESKKIRNIYVKKGTVIIDNSLLTENQEGRYNFTGGHEAGHWILHREMFRAKRDQFGFWDSINGKEVSSIKCFKMSFENYASRRTFKTNNDWMEWQANYMASCLLMPKKIFKVVTSEIFKKFRINGDYIILGQDFKTDEIAVEIAKKISRVFGVSVTAASIRLSQLRFIREKTIQL